MKQALLNRLEPIFDRYLMKPTLVIGDGDRQRTPWRKVWKEIQGGRQWIVDADLKDFFGSVGYEKLLTP